MLSRRERIAKLEAECDREMALAKLAAVARNPEARSKAFAKMLGNHIANSRGNHPAFLRSGHGDPTEYTILKRESHKSGSSAALAPWRKTDATEAYEDVPNRTYTPDTRSPAAQQFLPKDDDWDIFGPLSRSESQNAHGSVAARNVAYVQAYRQSAQPFLPGVSFEPPGHASHADNRSIGWDDEGQEPPATNYGAGKSAEPNLYLLALTGRGISNLNKRAPRNLAAEILDLDRQIAKAKRAGKHEHAADLIAYRRCLVADLQAAA